MCAASADAAPLVEVRAATLTRGGQRILDNVDLVVRPGEIVTLIGPNGAGKSTLVKVALGIEKPDTGYVKRKDGLKIGYQPQLLSMDGALPLTVRRFLTLTQKQPEERLRRALEEMQVPHLADASVHTLSGGEMQRVILARVMLREPGLLVLDEPGRNVDVNGAVEIYQLIARLRDEMGCGILLISHDLNVVMSATDRVYCLNTHICCSGHPEDVSRHPEYLRLFGEAAGKTLAVYTHAHDHTHTPHGDVDHVHDRHHDHKH